MTSRYSSGAPGSEEQVHLMDEDEGLSPTPSPLNRKSLVIFFGVTTVAAAIVICTVMVTIYSGKGGPFSNKIVRSADKYGFDDIFSRRFNPATYSANWISDDEYITSGEDGVVIKNLAEDKSEVLLDHNKKEELDISRYWVSPDRKYILFTKDVKPQYRYSFFAEYHIYDLQTKEAMQITPGQGQDPKKIQYATWDENEHSLVFVYNNDIYYMTSPRSAVKQLTTSGVEHKIFNGIPDWVYQEEVLNSDHALWFSPEGRYLAYIQFNDTEVNWYKFPWYGDRKNSYTTIREIAYPKPGYPNPTVKVYVIDLQNDPMKKIELLEPADFINIDHYVVNVAWASEKAVTVTWLNRDQNDAILHMCDLTSSQPYSLCKQNSNLRVQDGWVDDKYTTPLFSADGSYYITLWPFTQSGAGKFIHLAKMSTNPKGINNPSALTSGEWEILKILTHDDVNERVYFTATKESPTQVHVYSVDIKTSEEPKCWTCNLPTIIEGNKCSYYRASFSLKGSWYILYCLGPRIPEITLRSTKSKKVVPLEDNKGLRKRLEGVALPTEEIYQVDSDGYKLYVKEHRPPNFDERKKYAVLFSVYGGPGSQKVVDSYGYGFESYLVSNFDLIVIDVDARGTCCRGESFKHQVYKQLGVVEAADTINVAKYIAAKDYVDEKKIAIWGWSYGGFLASYVLGVNSGVFSVGMAVAPVTDWRYYDSIYTERYMLTPQQNFQGYEASSVLTMANNFKNDSFLLVHGTGDDNVHFQNTAQLVTALTQAGVKYQVQFYPDKNHGLPGEKTSHHLYHLLVRFLQEKLSLSS